MNHAPVHSDEARSEGYEEKPGLSRPPLDVPGAMEWVSGIEYLPVFGDRNSSKADVNLSAS